MHIKLFSANAALRTPLFRRRKDLGVLCRTCLKQTNTHCSPKPTSITLRTIPAGLTAPIAGFAAPGGPGGPCPGPARIDKSVHR